MVLRIRENIMFLEKPEEIEAKGGYVPGGILLWGPPGTGKTLMAEAVAGETGKPYVFVDPGASSRCSWASALKVKSLYRKLASWRCATAACRVLRRGGRAGQPRPLGRRPPAGRVAAPGLRARRAATAWPTFARHRPRVKHDTMATAGAVHGGPERRSRFIMGGGDGGGWTAAGRSGTLQALLTEISGLKKPRGILNRWGRRVLGMRPKPPPKYRILVMMATNMPEALDEALLRPGRIDRIYRVGYPSKAGRIRTYQGYLDKVPHEVTDEELDKLATITPYATGATIKDLVNEALITAIRDGREVITWRDVMKAKQLKDLGPPEDVEYIERERHAVAVHEACHAVVAYRTRQHMEIDLATIEKGSDYLGMVASIPPEDQFTEWRSEYEADILVARLAGRGAALLRRRHLGRRVGDLESATAVASFMEGYWGMGHTVSSYSDGAAARGRQPWSAAAGPRRRARAPRPSSAVEKNPHPRCG